MPAKMKITVPMTKYFTKLKALGLLMAVVVLSSSTVYADNAVVKSTDQGDSSHQTGDWKHTHHGQMMAKILNLTEDQVKQLKDSRQKQKETMKSVFEQMKANREAFDAEIIKATPDMSKINGLQTQLKTIQSQMADNGLNSILEIKKILTPEQFAGYMTLKKERKLMMFAHHRAGRGGFGMRDHKHWEDKDKKADQAGKN